MAIFMDNAVKKEIENVSNKACPFCGNDRLFVTAEESFEKLVKEHGSAMIDLRCKVCGMTLPLYNVPNENYWMGVGMLVGKWNTRNGGNNDGN